MKLQKSPWHTVQKLKQVKNLWGVTEISIEGFSGIHRAVLSYATKQGTCGFGICTTSFKGTAGWNWLEGK